MATLQIYPVGQKFRRNRSILQGFRDISIFMFCNFCEKFENSKWPPFLGRGKFFLKLPRVHCSDTLLLDNFVEIALSRTVKEIEVNLCFAIFGKNSKIQNGRHFGGGENFFTTAKSTFLRYPVGRKF